MKGIKTGRENGSPVVPEIMTSRRRGSLVFFKFLLLTEISVHSPVLRQDKTKECLYNILFSGNWNSENGRLRKKGKFGKRLGTRIVIFFLKSCTA